MTRTQIASAILPWLEAGPQTLVVLIDRLPDDVNVFDIVDALGNMDGVRFDAAGNYYITEEVTA